MKKSSVAGVLLVGFWVFCIGVTPTSIQAQVRNSLPSSSAVEDSSTHEEITSSQAGTSTRQSEDLGTSASEPSATSTDNGMSTSVEEVPKVEPATSATATTDSNQLVLEPSSSSSLGNLENVLPATAEAEKESAVAEAPIYRLYNQLNGEHLYTRDENEKMFSIVNMGGAMRE